MKYIVSRYNQDAEWVKEYTDDFVIYDRSADKLDEAIPVKNVGSDIHDKLTYIIDHYDNLPDVAVYTKCNLFKYITREEFDRVKDTKGFTPLLTQNHRTYGDESGPVCFYKDGIYWERNNLWYLNMHPPRSEKSVHDLTHMLGIWNMKYVPFAPGSNYILPKENILQRSKDFYVKLRSYLEWDRYPGECMIAERGLYGLWRR